MDPQLRSDKAWGKKTGQRISIKVMILKPETGGKNLPPQKRFNPGEA